MEKSGIYSIFNTQANKQYVGSAVNINKRWNGHRAALRLGKHHSNYLQKAWNKSGSENFKFQILAECPKEYLLKMEQWFIDNLNPEYNISMTAGSPLGYKHTELAKRKISLHLTGRKNSDETKKKRAESMKKNWEEYKIIGKVRKTRGYPVFQYALNGKFINKYNSVKEASLHTGASASHISSVVYGKRNKCGGFLWSKYYSEYIINNNNNVPD